MTENVDSDVANDVTEEEYSRYEERDRESPGRGRSIIDHVQWALFVILLLVVLVATFRFYFAASTAIDRFVTNQYRPTFQAAFNLAVLLVSGAGLSLLVRRMR